MRCYYEVLGVALDVNDDDLKKSYRALALKWHPDKNPDNAEDAKREFQEIQQAYTILSDPQERSFYDRHRDAIIKGIGTDYKELKFDISPYCTSSCFEGYDDGKKGFYTVYRKVFNEIIKEESEFSSEIKPEFGSSASPYELVHEFYAYWSAFCTRKTYSWVGYDIRSAENRKIMRLIEIENKKVREKLKKERNEEVRRLVLFVKKRDERVKLQASFLKNKMEKNMKKAEENRRKMIEKHKQNIASYKECEWNKVDNYEKELQEIESAVVDEFNDHSDDSDDVDDLYCVACNKYFKTIKAFANHENSKKHKENVIVIKNCMIDESNLLQQSDNKSDNNVHLSDDENVSVDDTSFMLNEEEVKGISNNILPEKQCKLSKKQKKKRNIKKNLAQVTDSEHLVSNEIPLVHELNNDLSNEFMDNVTECNGSELVFDTNHDELKLKPDGNGVNDILNELMNLELSKKQRKKQEREKLLVSKVKNAESSCSNNLPEDIVPVAKSNNKQSKNKSQNNYDDNKEHKINNKIIRHKCASCNEVFNSNNKLFQHLKNSGHEVYLTKKTEDKVVSKNKNK